MTENYKILIYRLDKFIQRFYMLRLFKGLLIYLLSAVLFWSFISFLEYFGYYDTRIRFFLFIIFVLFNGLIITSLVVKPLFFYLKFYSRDHARAAKILGSFFQDHLDEHIISTLQLHQRIGLNVKDQDLLIAAIEQKSNQLLTYPFLEAINFGKVFILFVYFVFILGIFLSGWFFFPSIFKYPGERILNYKMVYEKPRPFEIVFHNSFPLKVQKDESLMLLISTQGDIIPEEIIFVGNGIIREMKAKGRNSFSYTIPRIENDFQFFLDAAGFRFGPYTIQTYPYAEFTQIYVRLKYPNYTSIPEEEYHHLQDFEVIKGTEFHLNVKALNTQNLWLIGANDSIRFEGDPNEFTLSFKPEVSGEYRLRAYIDTLPDFKEIVFDIYLIEDVFPLINIVEVKNQYLPGFSFFKGVITDDFGFSGLKFSLSIHHPGDEAYSSNNILDLDFVRGLNSQAFLFEFNFNAYDIQPGHKVMYHFRVYDNDGLNGPKFTQSQELYFVVPTLTEMIEKKIQLEQEVESRLQSGKGDNERLLTDLENLRIQLTNQQMLSWEQRTTFLDLLRKIEDRDNQLKDLKNKAQQESFMQGLSEGNDPLIHEKLERIQSIFQPFDDPSFSELMKRIEKELEKLKREDFFQLLDNMTNQAELQEFTYNRALELWKQLQLENMFSDAINLLNQIKDEQGGLRDLPEKDFKRDSIVEKQNHIQQEFDFFKNIMKDINAKNEDLVKPFSIDNYEKEMMRIDRLLDSIQSTSNFSDIRSLQQSSFSEMNDLVQKMKLNMQAMKKQNLAEDIRSLRIILDNLLRTSFKQEALMLRLRQVSVQDPLYVGLLREQNRLRDDLNLIEDSLLALSRRQQQIHSIVHKELQEIHMNMKKSLEEMGERRKFNAGSRQQFVMMHLNNLALLLNESMQRMEQEMAMGGVGVSAMEDGSPMSSLREQQEGLNERLRQLQQGHKGEEGQSAGTANGKQSEQLARLAAEQEYIRKKLKDFTDGLRKNNQANPELEKLFQEMERIELDVVSRNINAQTLLRQERIVTRLLKHERAQLLQEQEEKRVGEAAKNYPLSNPDRFLEYNRNRTREAEMLRNLPPALQRHYKALVEKYFLNVD